ncbi:MED6-domain-containing protein [Tothia fuscella]|uniref:Mediator of RNA polymerase II transcription subunit 6 n=1 Tax=Tothia fuscella TaxID=1048955 RepID=A0A9P4U031_9PEZI|nr:MED6-domain-containing protein [Tothia fuscella]
MTELGQGQEEAAPSLDYLQWSDPGAIAFYGGIRADNVHLYFNISPFCEPTSNNRILQTQLGMNPSMFRFLSNRSLFEDRLSKMTGVEYVIVEGPSTTTQDMNPVWVIRKQDRQKGKKIAGQPDAPDQLIVLGTYFCVVDKIYQATSLQDIIQCRLMTVTHLLSRIYDTASSMQYYTPTRGHSYFPPVAKPSLKAGLESVRTSRANTPIADIASQSGLSQSGIKDFAQANDDRAIHESFQANLLWGAEFMDDNPITGEPGSFILRQTGRGLKEQQEKEAAAAAAAATLKATRETSTRAPSVVPILTPVPVNKSIDIPKKAAGKGSPLSPTGDGVKKKKKSKVGTPVLSPTSPLKHQP